MKNWLREHFLPMWAKETLLKELQALEKKVSRLEKKNAELDAYIRGIHRGLRANGQLEINK